eukprot:TRINITY_DN9199_c0_g1_i1.p1 TRINITY_DN9199_c0_g1~~TRINITY_DN9199_c0_g1_i1.p1  ORF type:complete len:700 (+),score=149.15 TRINITY_DN9199_c0_g1_i1:104-2203(+)
MTESPKAWRPAPLYAGVAPNAVAAALNAGPGGEEAGSRIMVKNTFIDICPMEEESSGEESPLGSPHRRNNSAPPSPVRKRNDWDGDGSGPEDEDDAGDIPMYHLAPDRTLGTAVCSVLKELRGDLDAEEQPSAPEPLGNPGWLTKASPGSPKKVAAKKVKRKDAAHVPLLDKVRPPLGMFLTGELDGDTMEGGVLDGHEGYSGFSAAPGPVGLGPRADLGFGQFGLDALPGLGLAGLGGFALDAPPQGAGSSFGGLHQEGPQPAYIAIGAEKGHGHGQQKPPLSAVPEASRRKSRETPGLGGGLHQAATGTAPGGWDGLYGMKGAGLQTYPGIYVGVGGAGGDAAAYSQNRIVSGDAGDRCPDPALAHAGFVDAVAAMAAGAAGGMSPYMAGAFGGGRAPFGVPGLGQQMSAGSPAPFFHNPPLQQQQQTRPSRGDEVNWGQVQVEQHGNSVSNNGRGRGGKDGGDGGRKGSGKRDHRADQQPQQQQQAENESKKGAPWIMAGALAGQKAGKGGGGVPCAEEAKANAKVPLSGGGPKRTDYIKKFGGSGGPGPMECGGGTSSPQHLNTNINNHSNNSNAGGQITTMMLKNIPCRKAQEEVMMHIDAKSFANRYDFFYLPRDVKFRANLGYAFINFLTPEDAARFQSEMDGYRFSGSGSSKACAVVPAHVQGLMNNLSAFKRTEVMRSSRKPYFSGVATL